MIHRRHEFRVMEALPLESRNVRHTPAAQHTCRAAAVALKRASCHQGVMSQTVFSLCVQMHVLQVHSRKGEEPGRGPWQGR